MAKMGCAKCGKMMKKGGVKKMAPGGSITNKLNDARGFNKSPEGGGNLEKQIYAIPNAGMTGPNRNSQTETMKKGGTKKSFPDMSGDGKVTAKDILMAKGVIKKPKAKFGATVKVQRSPKAGKVRSAGDQGYAAVGKREPGRIIKKVISKKK
jgi:hypothetical protein